MRRAAGSIIEQTNSQSFSDTVRAYVELSKPGILRLLLITAVCPMLVAQRGMPDLMLIVWTLLGLGLVSASANAMNMAYDQDIDRVMKRTMDRPLPSGRIDVRGALIFASLTGAVGVIVLLTMVNLTAALSALGGHLFYVFIYTMWLKRSTPHNIVIGGAAGAVPPLVGWAAVQGSLDLPAWIMFCIIFFWTPPHFWALSLYKREDYSRAGVPMLPVVSGEKVTKRQMVLYTIMLVPITLALGLVSMGWLYTISALVLGLIFGYFVFKAVKEPQGSYVWSKRTFAYSILYLALLFGAMSADALLVEAMKPSPQAPLIEFVPAKSVTTPAQ